MTEIYLKYLDSGAFSNIYKVTKEITKDKITIRYDNNNLKDIFNEKNICIKLSTLESGSKEYEFLKQLNHKNVIKTYFGYFDNEINLYIIGMNLYHGNLSDYKTNINFISFVNQMIDGIKYIHSLNIVHCDIKPQNILIKKLSNNELQFSIIDFNTSYIYKHNNMHIKFKKSYDNKIIGTINYCSLFILLKSYPYRRDDLESLFITCLYINSDLDEKLFTSENNLNVLRKFRLCMYQYKTIQTLRSYKFFEDIDYKLIKDLIIDDLN